MTSIEEDTFSELLELLADNQPFHSSFQIERFITIGAGRTTWGMYKQALREVRSRFDALKADYVAIARLTVEIAGLEERLGPNLRFLNSLEDAVAFRSSDGIDLAERRMRLEPQPHEGIVHVRVAHRHDAGERI